MSFYPRQFLCSLMCTLSENLVTQIHAHREFAMWHDVLSHKLKIFCGGCFSGSHYSLLLYVPYDIIPHKTEYNYSNFKILNLFLMWVRTLNIALVGVGEGWNQNNIQLILSFSCWRINPLSASEICEDMKWRVFLISWNLVSHGT